MNLTTKQKEIEQAIALLLQQPTAIHKQLLLTNISLLYDEVLAIKTIATPVTSSVNPTPVATVHTIESPIIKTKEEPNTTVPIAKPIHIADTHSLNDKFVHEKELTDTLETAPILSLKASILLNDKINFIANLFDGDANQYNETIEKLDKATDLTEAKLIAKHYVIMTNTPECQIAANDLLALINRRFAKK